MANPERSRFPGACRRFLAELPVHLDRARLDGSPSDPEGHAASCRSCSDRLAGARLTESLLRALKPVAAPAEASSEEFLSGIYERATRASEAAIGPLLQRTLRESAVSPDDAIWREDADRPELESPLRRLLPATRTPGWMWSRIRANLRSTRDLETRRTASASPFATGTRVGLLAAALLVSGLLLFPTGTEPAPTTNSPLPIDFVWQVATDPIDPSRSLSTIARVRTGE